MGSETFDPDAPPKGLLGGITGVLLAVGCLVCVAPGAAAVVIIAALTTLGIQLDNTFQEVSDTVEQGAGGVERE